MATPDLSRFERYLSTPAEDIQGRSDFNLTETEVGELHALAVQGEVSWDLYHQISNAQTADFIYRNSGQERGWNIGFIRKQLGRTTYRHYSSSGEDIHEWISWRLFPKGLHIERTRSQKDPLRIIEEVELAFSPDADLEGLWERQRPGLEEEGIGLLQKFPDDQFVQDMCFLPGDPAFEVLLVLSAGEQRKELTFPIALRYKPLLKDLEKEYTLDVTKTTLDHNQPLQRAKTEEIQEALAGLWKAVHKYDKSIGIPIPAYIENQLRWHMGEEFKRRSTDVEDQETGEPVLKARTERTGGSLDDPRRDTDGTETGTLGDTIAAPQAEPPDQRILLQQILEFLVDPIDKEIVRLTCKGKSQKEIGEKVGISQPAISTRLKRMGKRLKS